MSEERKMAEIYTILLGFATLMLGAANILVWAGGLDSIEIGIMSIGGDDFFRWGWGSIVVVFGGILMISGGAGNTRNLQQFSKVLLGALMVWIIAGTDIFAVICENIPAGEEAPGFFNSFAGFIGAFSPPYPPAVILLPFTLVFVYFLYAWKLDG